jgi:hypothetical protein
VILRWLALLAVVLAGLAVIVVCGYLLMRDMASLQFYFAQFNGLADGFSSDRELLIADAREKTYRINTFANGIAVLLGAILAAIGVHGLCVMPPRAKRLPEDA